MFLIDLSSAAQQVQCCRQHTHTKEQPPQDHQDYNNASLHAQQQPLQRCSSCRCRQTACCSSCSAYSIAASAAAALHNCTVSLLQSQQPPKPLLQLQVRFPPPNRSTQEVDETLAVTTSVITAQRLIGFLLSSTRASHRYGSRSRTCRKKDKDCSREATTQQSTGQQKLKHTQRSSSGCYKSILQASAVTLHDGCSCSHHLCGPHSTTLITTAVVLCSAY